MFTRFSLLALVGSIAHVWEVAPALVPVERFVPIDSIVPINNIASVEHFPYMMVNPTHQHLDVYYSMTEPTAHSKHIRHRRLNVQDVYSALAKESNGQEVITELKHHANSPWPAHPMVVDHPRKSSWPWLTWNRRDVIDRCSTSANAAAINKVCTQQLDTQPSIMLVPFGNVIHIKYPMTMSSNHPSESYILRTDVRTRKVLSDLRKKTSAKSSEAINKITSAAHLNAGQVDLSRVDLLLPVHWSYRDTTMVYRLLGAREADAIRKACVGQVNDLPDQIPVYIGHRGGLTWSQINARPLQDWMAHDDHFLPNIDDGYQVRGKEIQIRIPTPFKLLSQIFRSPSISTHINLLFQVLSDLKFYSYKRYFSHLNKLKYLR
ncbi:hypothetical protein PTTG_25816 [Puccinia triticina 1-1 BBBD Race 1]|uniref:Uncharacterized protein n=1 Tax=Puccinia triticina (isolate 1-1 / race 1 (BBBD)) TaxID=630390 RepID=A0A180H0K8_PUCT1|nr:hypothetical protein PTTG_25816 [Puccinia triticina 1-1 BBBD Race 1]